MPPVPEGGALVHAVRRTIVRTGQGWLRPAWRLAFGLLLRAIVAYLRGRNRASAAYVQGSFAVDRPVYGIWTSMS